VSFYPDRLLFSRPEGKEKGRKIEGRYRAALGVSGTVRGKVEKSLGEAFNVGKAIEREMGRFTIISPQERVLGRS